jgi:hypothetical protein
MFFKKAVSLGRRLRRFVGVRRNRFFLNYYLPDYFKIDGWLSETEAIGLYNTARLISRSASVVEIGAWQGKSTYCIGRALQGDAKLYVIDPFDATAGEDSSSEKLYKGIVESKQISLLENFKQNMSRGGILERIEILKGYSSQYDKYVPKIDMLMIDGDHSINGCSFDYIHYSPRIAPGGFLLFHDYYADRMDLGPAWVIENLVRKSKDFSFHAQYDSLWVAHRKLPD